MKKPIALQIMTLHALLIAGAANVRAQGAEDQSDMYWQYGLTQEVFTPYCRSIGTDGTIFAGEAGAEGITLPVGPDRWLECTTSTSASFATVPIVGPNSQPHCVLAKINGFTIKGDPDLAAQVTVQNETGPWVLTATSIIGAYDVKPTYLLLPTWPLWIVGTYTTVSIEPQVAGSSCNAQYGLEPS